VVEHDGGHGIIVTPGEQGVDHGGAHFGRQRMDRPWPVQADAADAILHEDDQLIRHSLPHLFRWRRMMLLSVQTVPGKGLGRWWEEMNNYRLIVGEVIMPHLFLATNV
jgi:hypothetical protein